MNFVISTLHKGSTEKIGRLMTWLVRQLKENSNSATRLYNMGETLKFYKICVYATYRND